MLCLLLLPPQLPLLPAAVAAAATAAIVTQVVEIAVDVAIVVILVTNFNKHVTCDYCVLGFTVENTQRVNWRHILLMLSK